MKVKTRIKRYCNFSLSIFIMFYGYDANKQNLSPCLRSDEWFDPLKKKPEDL